MQKVKIQRGNLLSAIRDNQKQHAAEFAQANEAYRRATIDRLREMLKNAMTSGGEIDGHTRLQAPEDHTEDYANAVRMLEMSVEDVIELNHTEFDMYVMDNWHWKGAFKSIVQSYGVK